MPSRMIDYDAIWSSHKLSKCTLKARIDYLWIYGLADAGGNFELTNLRVIWGQVAAIRPDLTQRRLQDCLKQFQRNGLLFIWNEKGNKFGHWVGSRKKGRLPSDSTKSRYYRVCPEPPEGKLEEYIAWSIRAENHDPYHDVHHDKDGELDLDGELDGEGEGKAQEKDGDRGRKNQNQHQNQPPAAQPAASAPFDSKDFDQSQPQPLQLEKTEPQRHPALQGGPEQKKRRGKSKSMPCHCCKSEIPVEKWPEHSRSCQEKPDKVHL